MKQYLVIYAGNGRLEVARGTSAECSWTIEKFWNYDLNVVTRFCELVLDLGIGDDVWIEQGRLLAVRQS